MLNVIHPVPPCFSCQVVLKGVFQSTQAMVCVQKFLWASQSFNYGYSMHVTGNARTFAFTLLWSNKARGSITPELVGDKGPDTAIGGSSSQFTCAVHHKLVRLSSQFEDLQNNMKKVVDFIEKFNKAFEESQTKSQNAQQQASVPSIYWHMVPQVQPQ